MARAASRTRASRSSQAEAACWHEVIRTEFYQGVPVQMKVREFVESEELRQAKRALAESRGAVPPHGPSARLGALAVIAQVR